MFIDEQQVRVRYADTDQMGFVYYGNYATYYEIGRVESLRSIGYSYKALEESGVMLPVLDLKSKYIKPAEYDDLLTIKTSVVAMPNVKFHFKSEIYNEAGELINIGEVTLVFIDSKTKRPCKPPKALTDLLTPYFN